MLMSPNSSTKAQSSHPGNGAGEAITHLSSLKI
jgi:hypothetical protein